MPVTKPSTVTMPVHMNKRMSLGDPCGAPARGCPGRQFVCARNEYSY